MSTQAVVAGHVCIDVIPRIDRPFDLEPGRLYEVGPPTLATGGPVSNTGVAMHILGIETTLMGKIGDDSFGQSILEIFNRYSPELTQGMIQVPGETTSYSVVINIPGRDRSFLHCPGANETFVADDVNYEQLGEARLFHLGYPPLMRSTYEGGGTELIEIYRRVKELGVTTSLDMAMPDPDGPSGQADWAGILAKVGNYVDIFLPSADELLYMLDRDHYGQGDDLSGDQVSGLGARLLELGVAVAGLKLGSRGLYIRTAGADRLAAMGSAQPADLDNWAGRELWFPVFRVDNFVGATGAGDTTIAGFLSALLRGLPLEAAGSAANLVGAMNVQAPDALGGLKSWEETMAEMTRMTKAELKPGAGGWTLDSETQIWRGPAEKG